ncbi:MAG: 7-cyano-7-deazaguanine synthase, partial [Clostridia bacterium]|nr:7-cyano-7-deazaguanine synthase [Clostridia bacterium]
MKEKVVIGLSGGVDSSVAAALLIEKGYEVIGVTMRLWGGEETENAGDGACCSLSAAKDAKIVADKLGIRHIVMDFRKEFEKNVINYFVEEYEKGRTPNPCIACNKHLKFDHLLKEAKALGARYIATGHYAKVEFNEETNRYELKMAESSAKDQTYALYNLTQEQLSHIIMPLGDLEDKAKTREIAEKYGLFTAKKPDSQEICF